MLTFKTTRVILNTTKKDSIQKNKKGTKVQRYKKSTKNIIQKVQNKNIQKRKSTEIQKIKMYIK